MGTRERTGTRERMGTRERVEAMTRTVTLDRWRAADPAISIGKRIRLQQGTDHKVRGLCPFHVDTEPSLVIWRFSDGTGAYKCFGCGAVGSTADFVSKFDAVSSARAKLIVSRESLSVTDGCHVRLSQHTESTARETWMMKYYLPAAQSLARTKDGQDWL